MVYVYLYFICIELYMYLYIDLVYFGFEYSEWVVVGCGGYGF